MLNKIPHLNSMIFMIDLDIPINKKTLFNLIHYLPLFYEDIFNNY